jgi:hypothetical protein
MMSEQPTPEEFYELLLRHHINVEDVGHRLRVASLRMGISFCHVDRALRRFAMLYELHNPVGDYVERAIAQAESGNAEDGGTDYGVLEAQERAVAALVSSAIEKPDQGEKETRTDETLP